MNAASLLTFLLHVFSLSELRQVLANNKTGFYFSKDAVYFKNGSLTQDQNQPLKELREFSLEKKCEQGHPISVAWQYYGPYSMQPTEQPNSTVGVEGIFPHLLNRMFRKCCASNVTVKYGKVVNSIRELEQELEEADTVYDLTFPLTGTDLETRVFKDYPYIAIVQAPRVALLVGDNPEKNVQTSQLLKTVFKAWPILIFIIVAATLSGIIIWLLDRLKNPDEFPRPFISGTWEGFWWAFVTMTTVGYGDRAPKSFLARIFCIVWILVGIIIIAIFTAIITASLSASIQHHFIVHGSKIGAFEGSKEYRLGVSLNAEMQAYNDIDKMNQALLGGELRGSLIDNYVLTSYSEFVVKSSVRIEMTYDHPVTYGVALRTTNDSRLMKCFERYMVNHPQEVFEVIAEYLEPLKNPTDDVSQEVKASEDLLFFKEPAFMKVLYILLGILAFLLLVGLSWELFYNRPRRLKRKKREPESAFITLSQSKCDCHEMLLGQQTIQNIQHKFSRMKQLVQEYDEFYEAWLAKVRASEEDGKDT